MKDCVFIQFYSNFKNSDVFDLGNGFSDTYDLCKSRGDLVWLNHNKYDPTLENFGYSSKFIINNGTAYISALYITHLYQIYIWALRYPDVHFIVGGPVITSDCFIIKKEIPKNITLVNESVENYFGISDFSQSWKLHIPDIIPNKNTIIFSYTLENKCYWGKCRFCTVSNDKKIHRKRKNINYEFKDIKYDGKKIVRLGTDSFNPTQIKKVMYNLPYFEGLDNYRIFMRAANKELSALKSIGKIPKAQFTLGLEFPTDRMWKYMNKGYNHKDVLDMIQFLTEMKVGIALNIILGWNNLKNEDIIELKNFMNKLYSPRSFSLLLHNLFIYHNSDLYNLYEKGEEYRLGPFYMGFFPKLNVEQLKLNERARKFLIKWSSKKRSVISDWSYFKWQ